MEGRQHYGISPSLVLEKQRLAIAAFACLASHVDGFAPSGISCPRQRIFKSNNLSHYDASGHQLTMYRQRRHSQPHLGALRV